MHIDLFQWGSFMDKVTLDTKKEERCRKFRNVIIWL